MAVPSDYTDEQIAEVIFECKGYIKAIAERLDVRSASLRDRIIKTPALRDLMTEQCELVTDNAELYLVQAIEAGKAWAIRFWLSRRGRDRGYGHKIEVKATVDADSRVVVYLPDDGREAKPNDGSGDSSTTGAAGHCPTQ